MLPTVTDHQTETTLRASNRNKVFRAGEALEVVTTCKLPLQHELYPEDSGAVTFNLRGALGFLTTPNSPSYLLLSTILSPKCPLRRGDLPTFHDHERAYEMPEHDAALHEKLSRPIQWIETNLKADLSIHGQTLHKFFFRLTSTHLSRATAFAPWAIPLLLPRRLPSALRYAHPSTTCPESLSLWLRLT